ncbi:MAG: hypothetical protein KF749_10125 [Bacteroidetes bacterium]|nr:hypothetical protein [Bacteroidota bacterium]MCW5896680.1 hypothetical protein [Bacteroidota bacterium]
MQFSEQTEILLRRVEQLANKNLDNRNDVGTLLEIAGRNACIHLLDELSFIAKFACKAFGIMKRIGKDADGYDKMSTEFGKSIIQSQQLIARILDFAPEHERKRLTEKYLVASPASFAQLLPLLADLSWYKNYLIDSREGKSG